MLVSLPILIFPSTPFILWFHVVMSAMSAAASTPRRSFFSLSFFFSPYVPVLLSPLIRNSCSKSSFLVFSLILPSFASSITCCSASEICCLLRLPCKLKILPTSSATSRKIPFSVRSVSCVVSSLASSCFLSSKALVASRIAFGSPPVFSSISFSFAFLYSALFSCASSASIFCRSAFVILSASTFRFSAMLSAAA